ncbi:MAG: ATP-binding protein [Planctomycetota bacterium]
MQPNTDSELAADLLPVVGPETPSGTFVTSRKRFIIVTRFLILAIVGVLAYREASPEHARVVYTILTVFGLSNLLFMFQRQEQFAIERISGWIFIFDTFFVTVFVFYLQARTTEFYLVYFLTIFIAASAKSAAAAIATSIVTALIYGVLTKYEKTGVALYSVSFFMRTIFFFVTAMVVGYFAEQVKQEREAREAAQRMLHLSNRLATLFDVSKRMVSTADLDQLARHVFDSAVRVANGDSGSLMLLNEETGVLNVKESIGLNDTAKTEVIRFGERVAGVVAQGKGAVLLTGDVSADPSYPNAITGRDIASAVCAPLKIGEKTLGVLNVNRGSAKPPFEKADCLLLESLANHAAIVLEKARLHEELERAYDASRMQYETLVNTANAMIFLTDSAGMLQFVNPRGAEMLGRQAEEIEGKPVFEFIHPDDAPKFESALSEVTREGKSVSHLEYRVGPREGPWRQHSASFAPLRKQTGEGYDLLGVADDVTDYVDLQKRLAQSAKLASLGTMVAGIAHELNNPLTGVIGFAELLKEKGQIKDVAGEELEMILKQADRCAKTVGGLLKFARQQEARKEPADINRIVRDSLDFRRREMRLQNIDVIEDYDPELPETAVDASQIQQVFLNIISNAFDAMVERHGRGTLLVRTSHDDKQVSIEFGDDGGGIEHIDKIFDPFYTTKDVGKGTGLGLSISYGIVEQHGGEIEARNAEGGARFTVRLPITPAAARREVAARPADASPRKGSVLVIDDEEAVLRVSRSVLKRMGHDVATAKDADEAMKKLDAKEYDVILADVRLPGQMDGLALYKWLEKNKPGRVGRVVFTTGDTLSAETGRFIRQTGAECISKPFHADTLRQTIQNMMRTEK